MAFTVIAFMLLQIALFIIFEYMLELKLIIILIIDSSADHFLGFVNL